MEKLRFIVLLILAIPVLTIAIIVFLFSRLMVVAAFVTFFVYDHCETVLELLAEAYDGFSLIDGKF